MADTATTKDHPQTSPLSNDRALPDRLHPRNQHEFGGKQATMTDSEETKAADLTALANAAAEKLSSDILFINHQVGSKLDEKIVLATVEKLDRHSSLVLVLVTEGGDPHTAYRCMRYLQGYYNDITIVVPGWCKSAGTLMCTGAHRLQIGPLGELGPMDVQLTQTDTGEVTSGLALGSAILKLQSEASETLMRFLEDAKELSYDMSLAAAVEIAKTMTIGLFQPVFGKLEPISIGEDYRAHRIAEAYAYRLDFVANNLRHTGYYNGLEMLLDAYPSHEFVIDKLEARSIFQNVDDVSRDLVELIGWLGHPLWFPLNRKNDENVIKFLNQREKVTNRGSDKGRSNPSGKRKR